MGLFKKALSSIAGYFGDSGNASSGSESSLSVYPWAAVAQGALDIGTGMINNAYAISAAQRGYNYAKQLIDYQNEYNLPINQRKRLEDAGLNPNYILGGISSTSASGSASGGTGGRMNNSLNLAAYQNLEAQNALLQQQYSNAYWQNDVIRHKGTEARYKAEIAGYNAEYAAKEHEMFKATGKIPKSYYRNETFLGTFERAIENFLQRFQ